MNKDKPILHYCPICKAPSIYAPMPSRDEFPKWHDYTCGAQVLYDSNWDAHISKLCHVAADWGPPFKPETHQPISEAILSDLLTGGNHLASVLLNRLGESDSAFPPYTATPEEAKAILIPANPTPLSIENYDLWLAWRAMMQFRDAVSALRA